MDARPALETGDELMPGAVAGGRAGGIGVQLVGAMGEDAKLLRTARWLERRLAVA